MIIKKCKGGIILETFETSTHRFVISIDNKDVDDMKHVMNEHLGMGYTKIQEIEHEGNNILIYAKKK